MPIDTTYLDADSDNVMQARPALLATTQAVNTLSTSGGSALVGYLPTGGGAATTVEARLREIYTPAGAASMKFQPSGIGALVSTVAAHLNRSFIYPENFGAVFDAVYVPGAATGTDDSAALQAAINHACYMAGGPGSNFPVAQPVTLLLPAGDAIITTGLVANRRINVLGQGMWATRLICKSNAAKIVGFTLRPDAGGGAPVWGATISDFQVVGDGGTTRCDCFAFGSTAPYTISQSTFQNLVAWRCATGFYVGDGSDNSFYNNRFFNIKVTGNDANGITEYGFKLQAAVYNTFEGIEVTCVGATAYAFYGTGGWNTFSQLACDGPSNLNVPNSTIDTFTIEGIIAAACVTGTYLSVNGAKRISNLTLIDCPNAKAAYGLAVQSSGCVVQGYSVLTTTGNSADKPNYPFAPANDSSGVITGFFSTYAPTFTFEQTIPLTTLRNWQISDCAQISANSKRTDLKMAAAPTTLTWAVGDRVVNSVPAVGQPKAWVCTVAGTPGTWVSEGNL